MTERDTRPGEMGETDVESMSDETSTGGLQVDPVLQDFVANELVAGLDLAPEQFWTIVADLRHAADRLDDARVGGGRLLEHLLCAVEIFEA